MIAESVARKLSSGSLIRKMFEEGLRLKSVYGEDKVYDFSLGNPDLDIPDEAAEAFRDLAENRSSAIHGYMSNGGYPSTRAAVAEKLSRASGIAVPAGSVIMTCGAAGGMNVLFRTLLDPGDEVIVLAPFFMEYLSYVDNAGGQTVVVDTDGQFLPDPEAVRKAITPRTKAVIINSPNNPTGVVYGEDILRALSAVLDGADHPIYLVSDEPYSEIIYDDVTVPPTLALFVNAIAVSSWSKSLSMAGERIGFIAVRPGADDYDRLMDGLVLSNRTLGFVNAPSTIQKVVERSLNARVDVDSYRKRRNRLHEIVTAAGFQCDLPAGALYLFAKNPMDDDLAFTDKAAGHHILCVPGSAFGRSGYFRLAFCVGADVIERSAPAFLDLGRELGLIQ